MPSTSSRRRGFGWLLVLALLLGGGWALLRSSDEASEPAEPETEELAEIVAAAAEQEEQVAPQTGAEEPPEEAASGELTPAVPTEGKRENVEVENSPALIWGRVLSPEGKPLAGAEVSWTGWDPEFLAYSLASVPIPAEEVQARSVTVTTDGQGRFRLEEVPSFPAGETSYLWVTHGSHLAVPLEVGEGTRELPEEQVIELEPAPGSFAKVVQRGAPVPGATVIQQAAFPRNSQAVLEKGQFVPKGLLLFMRRFVTDETGDCTLAPVEHRARVAGSYDVLRSLPWRGLLPDSVQLQLGATCTLEGQLTLPVDYEEVMGMPHVRVSRQNGPFREEVAAIVVHPDGTIGPGEVPVLSAENYILSLEGGSLVPDERIIPTPSPGQRLQVEFHGVRGGKLWFQAIDSEREILSEAALRGVWYSNGRRVERQVRARDDGFMLLMGIPPGIVHCDVSAPGFGRLQFGSIAVPELQPVVHLARLSPGSKLNGVCLQGIDPAKDFEVRYWAATRPKYRGSVRVTGSEDGKFVIDDMPFPRIALEAISAEFGRSEVMVLDLETQGRGEVLLHIAPPSRMSGTVVDPGTGEPVRGAQIQVYTSFNRRKLEAIGNVVTTASDGRFDIRRLGPGTNLISATAPGFAIRELEVVANAAQVDLGQIELNKQQVLTATLVLPEGKDPAGYVLTTTGVGAIPATNFDSNGEIRIEDASEGTFLFRVEDNLGDETTVAIKRVTLRAGEDWDLEFDVVGNGRSIRVTTSSLDPQVDPTQYVVGITYPDLAGNEDFQTCKLDESGEAVIFGQIGEGPVLVRLSAPGAKTAGGRSLVIDGDSEGEVVVHVQLDSKVVNVRVVDSGGQALPGIEITPRGSSSGGMVLGWEISDVNGEAQFKTLPPETDEVTLSSPVGGTVDGVPFEFPKRDDDWVELVFDMSSTIELFLHDGGVAQSTASCRLFSGEHGYTLTPGRTPDSEGRVTFADLGQGSYELHVGAPGCWSVVRQVEAAPTGSEYSVELRSVGTLDLEFQRSGGEQAAGEVIALDFVSGDESVTDWAGAGRLVGHLAPLQTDSAGRLRLEGIPRGEYRWSWGTAGGILVLGAGEVKEERLVLP